jgi:Enoyl-(Acyl carrier protein) reductase
MKTDLIIDLLAKEGRHIEEGWVKDVPMGRLGRPSELQGTIVWMASDASSYLNGSDIVSALHPKFHPKFSSQIQLLTVAKRSLMVGTAVGEIVLSSSANIAPNLPTHNETCLSRIGQLSFLGIFLPWIISAGSVSLTAVAQAFRCSIA